MDRIVQLIQSLLPEGTSRATATQLKSMLGLNEALLVDNINDLTEGDEAQKSITAADIAAQLQKLGYEVTLPGQTPKGDATLKSFPYGVEAREAEPVAPKGVYQTRFNSPDAARKAIAADVIGSEYEQTLFDQTSAFTKAMRSGDRSLSAEEMKLATTQIFSVDDIYNGVANDGFSTKAMKALQVEAQGELGGFAVPSTMQAEIRKRLPTMTNVRGSGARVIQLTSKSTDIPVWRGNGNDYVGLLRIQWEGEGADPSEQNWKMDMVPVQANLMTFKIKHSQSLVEDAANLTSLLMADIASTVAVGEDFAFVNGDGVGKPLGILPGGANSHSLKEVNSGAATTVTAAGIKKLKRGVASQYRREAKWLANSDTYSLIEALTAGAGTSNWAFPDLSETEMSLAKAALESEGMPDVAASAYPLLFANMAGYTIVERLGLAVQRFQDSATGINRVEYHVRKRVGGILTEPWQFAVQKISA